MMRFVRKTLMSLCLLSLVGMFSACGTPITDGVVLNINPTVVRVGVNEVTTVQVFLTKPREKAGELTFYIDDSSILAPATKEGKVAVQPGQDMISFDVQGIKTGRTGIKAKLDGNIVVRVPVIVSAQ